MFGWFDELKKWLSGGQKQQQPKQQAPQQQRQQLISVPGVSSGAPQQRPTPQPQQKPIQQPKPTTIQQPKQPQINVQEQDAANAAKVAQIKQQQDKLLSGIPTIQQEQRKQALNKVTLPEAQKASSQVPQNVPAAQRQKAIQDKALQISAPRVQQEQKAKSQAELSTAPYQAVRGAVTGAGRSIGTLPGTIMQAAGTVGKMATPDSNKSIDSMFEKIRTSGRDINSGVNKSIDNTFGSKMGKTGFAFDVGSGAGQLGADIGLTIASGGASAVPKAQNAVQMAKNLFKGGTAVTSARYGAQEMNEQFDQAKAAGRSDTQAGITGVGAGAAQYGLEKIGLDRLLKPGQGNMAVSALKRAATEGSQEGAQQFSSNAFEKTYNEDKNLMDDVARSAAVGAVVGGGVSPVIDVAQASMKPPVTKIAPSTPEEHKTAVDNGIVTPMTARSSLDDMIRTAENSDLNPNRTNSQRTLDAFNAPSDRRPIGMNNDVSFEMGAFGDNALQRKAGNPDRITQEEIAESIPNIQRAYRADSNPESLRYDNVAWVADMPEGGQNVIYTRQDENGAEEIINAHKIGTVPNYEDRLASFGTPAQSRTGGFGLEHLAGNPAHGSIGDLESLATSESSRHSDNIIADEDENVKFRMLELLRSGEITEDQYADLLVRHDAMFGDNSGEVSLVDDIYSPNGQALGATVDNINGPSDIQIARNQSDPESTLFHESVHKALNDYMTSSERREVINSYAKDKRISQDQASQREYMRRTEELMAEDFIQYAANQNSKEFEKPSLPRRISDIFNRVLRRLQHIVLQNDQNGTLPPAYLQFYRDLHEGKFASREMIDKSVRDRSPEVVAIQDHIKLLQHQFDTTTDQHARHVINKQIAGLNREVGQLNSKQYREQPIRRTKAMREAIDDEIGSVNPELFYQGEDLALGEDGSFDMPRLHVDDIRHYFGQAGLEDIPTRYKRRTGSRDIDQLAAAAGYDDIDSYVEALHRNLNVRRQSREKKSKLTEERRNPEVVSKAQRKLDMKRADAEAAVAEFKDDRKEALQQGDKDLVSEIEDMIRAIENDAGLSKTKFAKTRQINVGGPRSFVTEYVASSYKDENNKDISELIKLDKSKHTLKNGTVVDKDGRNVGSYVGIDELGQQYAYLEGKPVNITGILGDIDTWGNMSKSTWDMDRMIERNAPDKATARRVQKFTTVFKDRQEAAMKTEIVQRRAALEQTEKSLVKNLPKGVKKEQLSEDLFRIMEKKTSLEEIVGRYGESYVNNHIKPAIQKQRKEFDQILDEVNSSLVNNGFDPIPKRDNYITHIQEDPKFWEKFGIGIHDITNLGSSIDSDVNPGKVRGSIPEEIVGNTANTSARKRWNPFAQTRRGSAHKQDFFAAIDSYYEPMLFNKYMTPAASRARLVERTFRTFEKAKEIRAEELLDVADMGMARDMAGLNKHRTHKQYKADRTAPFILEWQEYGNKLAGKSNKIDRTILESGYGQKIVKASTKLQGITGANTIPGSATAALAQTLSLPQTFARDSAKSFAKGIKDTMFYAAKKGRASKDGAKDPLMSSSFMRARYTDATSRRKTLLRKYTDKAAIPMQAIERTTAEISWRSAFAEARSKGLKFDDAIKEADLMTKQTLAGRGIGDRPLVMDSKAMGALTQFGLEVNNMRLQFWKDFTPTQKSKFIVGAFALNWMYGLTTGQTPLPDYLKATIDNFMDMLDWEDEDETLTDKAGGAIQRYAGETAKFVPGAGAIANTLPEKFKHALFGEDSDVSRFGTMAVMKIPDAAMQAFNGVMSGDMDEVRKAVLKIVPTGTQINRTAEGISTMNEGAARTSTGNLTTTVDNENPWKWLQAVFFGKNALSEVQGVYENKSYATNGDQTKIYESIKEKSGIAAANEYLNRIRTQGGENSSSSDSSGDTPASVAELKAKLDIAVSDGNKYIENGVVYKKDGDIDRAYYKAKADALGDSQSDETYRAYLEGYDLTVGTKYGKEKEVSTGNTFMDELIKGEAKNGGNGKTAASKAIGLFMDNQTYKKVPDWVKDKYYKDAGFTKEDVEYGALTKVGKEAKLDMLYRPIAQQDHGKLLDTLWAHRKMSINNKYVAASDTIITTLQKEGYLTKAEAKTLKGAKLDKDMKNTVADSGTTSSRRSGSRGGRRSSGRGSKAAGKEDYSTSDINAYIKSLSGSDNNDASSIVAKYANKKFSTSFKSGRASSTAKTTAKSKSKKKVKTQIG